MIGTKVTLRALHQKSSLHQPLLVAPFLHTPRHFFFGSSFFLSELSSSSLFFLTFEQLSLSGPLFRRPWNFAPKSNYSPAGRGRGTRLDNRLSSAVACRSVRNWRRLKVSSNDATAVTDVGAAPLPAPFGRYLYDVHKMFILFWTPLAVHICC